MMVAVETNDAEVVVAVAVAVAVAVGQCGHCD